MRFSPESDYGANAGLGIARDLLEPLKKKYGISYGDLWTLAGVVSINEMGGPKIPWRPGRQDQDKAKCTPDGRLPDATQGSTHLRDIFYRMGFNDREIVALSGAHCLGKCHVDRSGFKGPWTFSPTTFSNEYFKLLLSEVWVQKHVDRGENGSIKVWSGPLQYTDKTGTLMMLPSDLALINDDAMKVWVQKYSKDEKLWFEDFSKAFQKLLELGCENRLGSFVDY
jgi:cytochrome c peroxidase